MDASTTLNWNWQSEEVVIAHTIRDEVVRCFPVGSGFALEFGDHSVCGFVTLEDAKAEAVRINLEELCG